MFLYLFWYRAINLLVLKFDLTIFFSLDSIAVIFECTISSYIMNVGSLDDTDLTYITFTTMRYFLVF